MVRDWWETNWFWTEEQKSLQKIETDGNQTSITQKQTHLNMKNGKKWKGTVCRWKRTHEGTGTVRRHEIDEKENKRG